MALVSGNTSSIQQGDLASYLVQPAPIPRMASLINVMSLPTRNLRALPFLNIPRKPSLDNFHLCRNSFGRYQSDLDCSEGAEQEEKGYSCHSCSQFDTAPTEHRGK
ncbi:hypothetical protein chiPu_0018981 [Chiloscyllium punctatum]|uniref:Uncharacterized protein n=1 Tax=Chiloscyllium punctatum TaxID=137246 RepID=A0A401RQC2_CHIPU|nr:hypothetical protein [Chiloscyllium punctatum]